MEYINRAGWGSTRAKPTTKIGSVYGIGVHYTYRPEGHSDHALCDDDVRTVQKAHVSGNGWSDIAYSWLVCQHGKIYEGRGWGLRTAANGTNYGNEHFHAVCAITGGPATDAQKRAINEVIAEHGRRYQKNDVKGHRDFKATGCPGDEIYAWIKGGRLVDSLVPPPQPTPTPPPVTSDWKSRLRAKAALHLGANSYEVRILQGTLCAHATDQALWWGQGSLGVFVDGDFGGATQYALSVWQDRTQSLGHERGYAGPDTWAWLGGEAPLLKQGSADTHHVKLMQGLMIAHGMEDQEVDGIFGTATLWRLADWQKRAGLVADGICGPRTWSWFMGV